MGGKEFGNQFGNDFTVFVALQRFERLHKETDFTLSLSLLFTFFVSEYILQLFSQKQTENEL